MAWSCVYFPRSIHLHLWMKLDCSLLRPSDVQKYYTVHAPHALWYCAIRSQSHRGDEALVGPHRSVPRTPRIWYSSCLISLTIPLSSRPATFSAIQCRTSMTRIFGAVVKTRLTDAQRYGVYISADGYRVADVENIMVRDISFGYKVHIIRAVLVGVECKG